MGVVHTSPVAWSCQCLPKRPRLHQIPPRTKSHLVSWGMEPSWLRSWRFNNSRRKIKPDFSSLDPCSILSKAAFQGPMVMQSDEKCGLLFGVWFWDAPGYALSQQTCSTKRAPDPRRNSSGERDVHSASECGGPPGCLRRTSVPASVCVDDLFQNFLSITNPVSLLASATISG